jgi:hypothetical protein
MRRILNLPLIVKAKASGPLRSSEWFDALYPVAIPFPASSKTQAAAFGKQIPRARLQLCAVFTMMWRGSDDTPPLLKAPRCAKLVDQELLVGCLVAGQHLAADG